MLQRLIALILFLLFLPLLAVFYFFVKLTSNGPFIFKQRRMGKNKRIFTMYKVRTMVQNAERLKKRYIKLNEVDGPVFKIKDDPRFTGFGKILSYTGLDELPQLINIIKGEMAFVGPRPLPINEAKKVPQKYQKRFNVLPGVTSPWVLKGQHNLDFKKWMELDVEYTDERSKMYDLRISLATIILIIKLIFRKLSGRIK